VRSTIDHSTSCFEATWAYRLAPWISTARAMSRTLVPEYPRSRKSELAASSISRRRLVSTIGSGPPN
jgi:hypothetical protein